MLGQILDELERKETIVPVDANQQAERSPDNIYGFAGLGAMGMPIASRIATAVDCLAVSDTSEERMSLALAVVGSAAVGDPEVFQHAQTLFLCLPSQTATQSVIEDLLKGPALNRTIIDFGAHPPTFVSEMVGMCQLGSAQYCDCPVFGTPSMAERGDLYFLFSGPEQAAEKFEVLVSGLGYSMRYAGPSGTASSMKVLQNAIGTANLAVAAEALRVCEATGADTNLFIDVVRECGGIGLSTVFDRFAEDMATRRDSGEGRMRIAAKDMQSAMKLANSKEVNVPLLKQTADCFKLAMEAGLGEHQFTDIIKLNGLKL